MKSEKKKTKNIVRGYIAPIFIGFVIIGIVAIFAGLGSGGSSGSSGNNTTSNSPPVSSDVSYLVPIYSSADFESTYGNVNYVQSNQSEGGITMAKEDGKGKVMRYDKTGTSSGSGESFVIFPYDEAKNADSFVAEFDIYIDSGNRSNSTMSYQLMFNELNQSPFIATIGTNNNGFWFGEMSKVSGVSPQKVTSVLSYDTWHTITIEADMSSEEEFKVVYYADDVEIGTSYTFVAPFNSSVSGIYFRSNSSVLSTIKLDNLSLYVLTKSK